MKKQVVLNQNGTVDGDRLLTPRQKATAIFHEVVDLNVEGVQEDLESILRIAIKEGPIEIHFKEH